MRTIKFRGKSDDSNRWFYGFLQKYQEKYISRLCIYAVSVRTWEDALLYSVKPDTVGQFTGLLDKNGKEIYEGDILDFNGITVEVRFVRGVFALLVNGNLDEELCGDCRTDLFAKVIGNIHDNPELMKVNEKSKIRKHDTRRNP